MHATIGRAYSSQRDRSSVEELDTEAKRGEPMPTETDLRIDLTPPETWSTLCDAYRAQLPFEGRDHLQIQTYAGYRHALEEVTRSLSELFAHKKTIAIATNTEPAFESIAVTFSEDGAVVKPLSPGAEASSGLAEISKDLLFTLVSEDDPVTSQLYDFSALDVALKDQRVFRISLSHASFRAKPLRRPGPYEIQILSLNSERALVIAGERCRISPILAPKLPWKLTSAEEIARELKPQAASYADVITAFEAKLPAGFRPYFKKGDARIGDRAVIWHPDFDGSAIIDELAPLIGLQVARPGAEGDLESASPCRWTSPRLTEWFLLRGENEETLRGLVIIAGQHVNPELSSKLETAAKNLARMQNG